MALDEKDLDLPIVVRAQLEVATTLAKVLMEDISAGRTAVANLVGLLDAIEHAHASRAGLPLPSSLEEERRRIRKQANAWLDKTEALVVDATGKRVSS